MSNVKIKEYQCKKGFIEFVNTELDLLCMR